MIEMSRQKWVSRDSSFWKLPYGEDTKRHWLEWNQSGIGNMIRIIIYNLIGFEHPKSILCPTNPPKHISLVSLAWWWGPCTSNVPSPPIFYGLVGHFTHLPHYHSPILNLRPANQTLKRALTWHPMCHFLINDFTRAWPVECANGIP